MFKFTSSMYSALAQFGEHSCMYMHRLDTGYALSKSTCVEQWAFELRIACPCSSAVPVELFSSGDQSFETIVLNCPCRDDGIQFVSIVSFQCLYPHNDTGRARTATRTERDSKGRNIVSFGCSCTIIDRLGQRRCNGHDIQLHQHLT